MKTAAASSVHLALIESLATTELTMTRVFHRSLFLAGPAGRLEAMLWSARKKEAPLAAVVCHPHPLYGGTLHNKVVFQAAKTLHSLGLSVLRFDFRGAGRSEGTHDGGRGEVENVCACSWKGRITSSPGNWRKWTQEFVGGCWSGSHN